MSDLSFLYFLNRSPHKEVLACLALKEGLNIHQILDSLIDRRVGATIADVKMVLLELEYNRMVTSINSSFYFQEKWFRELVRFLDEFEESKKEMDLCKIMLEKNSSESLPQKK